MNPELKEIITFRGYKPEDEAFIVGSWQEGYYHGNDNDKSDEVKRADYFKNYRNTIKHILARKTVSILVACLVDDHDCIIGYSVSEPTLLHWVFVRSSGKYSWRKKGIGSDLVAKSIKSFSHSTKLAYSILKNKGNPWEYLPVTPL